MLQHLHIGAIRTLLIAAPLFSNLTAKDMPAFLLLLHSSTNGNKRVLPQRLNGAWSWLLRPMREIRCQSSPRDYHNARHLFNPVGTSREANARRFRAVSDNPRPSLKPRSILPLAACIYRVAPGASSRRRSLVSADLSLHLILWFSPIC